MSFIDDARKDAVKSALEIYNANVRIASLLDDKAQKAGGLAGIFLAAALGFVKPKKSKFLQIPIVNTRSRC